MYVRTRRDKGIFFLIILADWMSSSVLYHLTVNVTYPRFHYSWQSIVYARRRFCVAERVSSVISVLIQIGSLDWI
jgi:hypothetical protein